MSRILIPNGLNLLMYFSYNLEPPSEAIIALRELVKMRSFIGMSIMIMIYISWYGLTATNELHRPI